MDKWTEVEDNYLTNQPLIYRGRKQIPDPDIEPTEMYLFCYDAKRTPKGRRVRRKRMLHTIKGAGPDELESKLMDFTLRDDVILISSQRNPNRYVISGADPTRLDPLS